MGLSNAERQRRYINRLKARAAETVSNAPDTVDKLEQALAEAKARVAVLEALPGSGPADLTLDQYADAMVERLRGSSLCEIDAWVVTFNERLQPLARELGAVARKPKRATDRDKVAALAQELAQAKQEPAQARAAKAPLPPDEERDRQIKSLTTANQNLKAKARVMDQHFKDEIAKRESVIASQRRMNQAMFIAVTRALHSDTTTAKLRDEACGLITQWKKDQDKARSKAR